jgi:hypothetical protein
MVGEARGFRLPAMGAVPAASAIVTPVRSSSTSNGTTEER